MKPFRKNVAIAIDGGGIRGIIITRALRILEEALGLPVHDIFRLTAGTSTGSVIAAGIAAGLTAGKLDQLYIELGAQVFPKSWRSFFWPLTKYRYSNKPFIAALERYVGGLKMGDFWSNDPPTDIVITTYDLKSNHTRFIKPWKKRYQDWTVIQAVLASSAVPTYFPVIENRYIDGGIGSYLNPCYLAAYEVYYCLGWDPAQTTLISLGSGRGPNKFQPEEAERLWAWQWLEPMLGAFYHSADDQQVHLVRNFFRQLDFRRYQVDLRQPISMDDFTQIPLLTAYGEELGRMILNNQTDKAQHIIPKRIQGR